MRNNRETIVMVTNDNINTASEKAGISDKYDLLTVSTGKELFQVIETITPDIILLDSEISDMGDHAVIKTIQSTKSTEHTPIILLDGKCDSNSEVRGFDLGAVDYVKKPFTWEPLLKRVNVHIILGRLKREFMKYTHDLENEITEKNKTVFELQSAILHTIAELVECRDSVTGGHIERTQNYLSLFLDFLLKHNIYTDEISAWDIELFIMSSQLHDVGKIAIKDDILMKTGLLTDYESEEMRKHSILGMDIIKKIESITKENVFLQYAKTLAISHHEKWDGTGYPYGLKGMDIPLQGRLMSIVDVYDALTNSRPYKEALTHNKAIEIIKNGTGTHFEPLLNAVFLEHEREFRDVAISRRYYINAFDSILHVDNLYVTQKMIADIVDIRAGKAAGHTENMQSYIKILTDALLEHEFYKDEVSAWDMDIFFASAQLHDAGEISVRDHILNKTGKLSDEEFEKIKSHTDFGVKIIQKIRERINNGSLLFHAEALISSHHEKWDGSGYPLGLKGRGIPLQGRIMAIVDVYDALMSDRPHRKRLTHQEAVETIKSHSGTHFDPALVDVFIENEREFERLYREREQNL